ncbi:hypothetical protein [Burkholderia pyrrocinia]
MSKFITRWLWIEEYLLNAKSQEGISRMPTIAATQLGEKGPTEASYRASGFEVLL